MDNLEIIRQIVELQRIYAALYESPIKIPPKTLLVTSASLQEGKTTLTAGLGLLGSEDASKTFLLMDLNWYTPALHTCFHLDQNFCLEDLVSRPCLGDYIQDTTYGNLKMLTAPTYVERKTISPKEIVSVSKKLIDQARQEFDHVILDSASVYPVNRYMLDPVTAGAHVQGTLMMVMANMTHRSTVKKAKIILESSRSNLLGIVVNHHRNPLK